MAEGVARRFFDTGRDLLSTDDAARLNRLSVMDAEALDDVGAVTRMLSSPVSYRSPIA
jgi:hypothetical protein